MSQIECKKICVNYESTVAVKDVSFSVEEGDYVCIVGENGSGKSTLLKAILGLEPIKSGEVILGENVARKDIGYLPQQSINQKDFPASVLEVVLSGCLNYRGIHPFYSQKEKQLAEKNIKELGLEKIKNNSYQELSGGQRQRVLLARALCATRKILLLDEPIAGLDPKVTKEMYKIIKQINKEGITIIMVSHDIHFALKNANKILHMRTKNEFFGTTEEYIKSDIGKAFIGGGEND